MLNISWALALKAECLHLAVRTPEALTAIEEAETIVESSGERWWQAELHRLRGVFLTAMDSDQAQIETSSARQSESQRNRNRFHWRNARKKPTPNTEGKKRADQEDVDFACLFVNANKKIGGLVGSPP